MQKIIGVCGLLGSGKGTVADMLVDEMGFEKISFADKLKDGVAAVFGWPRHLLEGDTRESREFRELPDEHWSAVMGEKITPRLVLQKFGTECMRKGFHADIWVNIVKIEILKNPNKNYVIPDARFYNEQDMITGLGGKVWAVFRGDVPEWWGDAVEDNMTDSNFMYKRERHIHESEYRWARPLTYFDQVVWNNGTLDDLRQKVMTAQ